MKNKRTMKNIIKTSALVTALLFCLIESPLKAQTTTQEYFYVSVTLSTREGDRIIKHALYSAVQYVEYSMIHPESKIQLQWLDVIKINHPDLIRLYGSDKILRSTHVWFYDTREKAEKEKRTQMAKSSEDEAKIITVNFTYYKD